tara:strand:+ start:772 stop:1005 length:234 start_codon:yes stop_codon:yes gene_type:complete
LILFVKLFFEVFLIYFHLDGNIKLNHSSAKGFTTDNNVFGTDCYVPLHVAKDKTTAPLVRVAGCEIDGTGFVAKAFE